MVPKLYKTFYEKRVFTLEEAIPHFPDHQQARNAVHYMKMHGYLKQIKAGLYCIIPFEYQGKEDYSPDLILIGSHLAEPYFFSHLTALHIYGFDDRPMPRIVVTSQKRFRRINFQERIFQNVYTKHFWGYKPHLYKENLNVNVSTLERTFLDCLNHLKLAGGPPRCYKAMHSFGIPNFYLLMEYLEKIGNKTLMAKVGFTLEYFRNRWEVPQEIIDKLRIATKGETIYILDREMTKGTGELNKTWNMIIPQSFREWGRQL